MRARPSLVDVIEGRAPRPGVCLFTLGFAILQALYGMARVVGAPVVMARAVARSRAAVERARLEDEAFEDAARLNAARRPWGADA